MRVETEGAASQYAEAMLQIASKSKDLPEQIANDLQTINQVIDSNPNLKLVLGHPSVSNDEKKNLLSTLFAKKVQDLTQKLIELLTDKRRLILLPHIESQYKARLNELKQIVTAKLISSDPLSDLSIANVKARLSEHVGKHLELEISVDQSLIGGFILRIGDQVIDGSLKGKLRSIEKALLAG